MNVKAKKLNRDAKIPTYAEPGASGFDFYSTKELTITPGGYGIIGTGLAFEIPRGYEIQVRGRSGLAFKHQIVAAHFGTIDESYRGEVKILLFNFSNDSYHISPGERVAQGILSPVTKADFKEVVELSKTERGEGGIGSTGR